MVILRELGVNEGVLFQHDIPNGLHVHDGFGLGVFDWLPVFVPEELVRSKNWILFMSDHTERWHAVRDVESSVKSTVESLRGDAPHIIVLDRVYLHGSKSLESTWLELNKLVLILCGTLWVNQNWSFLFTCINSQLMVSYSLGGNSL